MMTVQADSCVLAHYLIYLSDGSVAENTYHSQSPVKFVLGDGSLSDPLERGLLGLAVGEKVTIALEPEDCFGHPVDSNLMNIPRAHFPADMELEEGLIVGFNQPNGVELPGLIRRLMGELILVDFNHPLAGQSIKMEMEVLEIS